jgi:hypothetical protein
MCVSRYVGGESLHVYGVGLDYASRMSLADRILDYTSAVWMNATDSDEAASVLELVQRAIPIQRIQMLTFITPALVRIRNFTNITSDASALASATGVAFGPVQQDELEMLVNPPNAYKPLKITALLPGTQMPQSINFTRLVFYTSSECIAAGIWKDDGQGGCLPCPAGGVWYVFSASHI